MNRRNYLEFFLSRQLNLQRLLILPKQNIGILLIKHVHINYIPII